MLNTIYNHDDLSLMKNVCKNIYLEYKDKYEQLFISQKNIDDFGIVWSNGLLEYKPHFYWTDNHWFTKIYKKEPKTVIYKYFTKVDLKKNNRPYFCSGFQGFKQEKFLVAQFFIFEKLNNTEIFLFYIPKNNNMNLEKIEFNVYDIEKGETQFNYFYGIGSDLNEYFVKSQYVYEKSKVSKVIKSGDIQDIIYILYQGEKVSSVHYNNEFPEVFAVY